MGINARGRLGLNRKIIRAEQHVKDLERDIKILINESYALVGGVDPKSR